MTFAPATTTAITQLTATDPTLAQAVEDLVDALHLMYNANAGVGDVALDDAGQAVGEAADALLAVFGRGGQLADEDASAYPAVVDEQRLGHPNPHQCAHCTTNRPTLLLILATGEQVTVCRPHATWYPR